ncbi:MAG: DsbA family oxidoreductase [Trueperaceae bacterium]
MKVEIWSDVVCPFCYVGKRRFENALSEFEHRDGVEVIWRSFELDANAPTESEGSLDDMLAKKYGMDLEQAKVMNARVTQMAADEGLGFRLEEAKRGNTFDAHRLIHLAAAHGLRAEAKERLLRAYFTEGKPIGSRETLIELAAELGLDRQEAGTVLGSDAYAAEVRADEQRAAELHVNGVPFFVFDGRYGVSGAQETETFAQVLRKAWDEAR